jgi:pyridoxal phosphate enzyme (YggS family)
MSDRDAELAANLVEVRRRIARAAAAAGRDAAEITLVAISKTWPADDVRRLFALGVTAFGENRDQEAAPKAHAVADLAISWHFVGQLQTNKATSVVDYADVIESVDRPKLVRALDRAALALHRRPVCLIQVDLDPAAADDGKARGGALPQEVPDLAAMVAASERLRLGGVMAVAPLAGDPAPAFARLAGVAAELRRVHPDATIVSAGMSHDLEAAVAAGATHVRVGTAVFGRRPSVG